MSFVSPLESVPGEPHSSAPCDTFSFHCREMLEVIVADPSCTHPSLPAIPAAALGLTAHPMEYGEHRKGR